MGKNSTRPCSNPKAIFEEADYFYLASEAINRASNAYLFKDPDFGYGMIYASRVNHAFAFELYLKCLQVLESGEYIQGHNLVVLFNKLKDETKKKIAANHDGHVVYSSAYHIMRGYKKNPSFIQFLRDASNAFMDLRYLFEDGNKITFYDLDFPIKYVRRFILELRPDFHNPAIE